MAACGPFPGSSAIERGMNMFMPSRSNSTFKPRKRPKGSEKSEAVRELSQRRMETLGSGNLRAAVRLPEGEDPDEWVAVNIVDFFNQITMLYGTITEYCTPEKCPVMSAGPKYEYYWADGQTTKKPIKCTAPQYIDYLLSWVQEQLEDDALFPSKIGQPFPPDFMCMGRTIMKRLFRVYAHIYYQHFSDIEFLKEEAHLNTSFKHFVLFVNEFHMIDKKELQPLQELIEKLTSQ